MAELYGRDQKNFDYSSAPERGRLEGIRDFTDKPVYRLGTAQSKQFTGLGLNKQNQFTG